MAKYYCEYCGIHLTHDSLAERRAHNSGWKHRGQVQIHYAGLGTEKFVKAIAKLQAAYIENAKGDRRKGMEDLHAEMQRYLEAKQEQMEELRAREREKKLRSRR